MKLTRLRLSGFKSFVEAQDFAIEPGLTGVVGPNGCGKSNLVEGLRWVMGENAQRALRAADMDDVIFAGSGTRSSRNLAEVVVAIDNSAHTAPAPFTLLDDLEVSRRIERGRGSTYRINGREVRARDVQLLFADASTGARSPALVRQGQIAEIIAARPQARRRVLEEAAGIAGLHARRHEAELRLSHAGQNLTRVEDVLLRMAQEIDRLRRGARGAARYRELSAAIRTLEALLARRAEAAARAGALAADEALEEASRALAEAQEAQARSARDEALAERAVPALREAAAAAQGALGRARRAVEDLVRRRAEALARTAELTRRLAELETDLDREAALSGDAERSLADLRAQHAASAAARPAEEDAASARHLAEAQAHLDTLRARHDEATARLAAREAERSALARQADAAAARVARLETEEARLKRLAEEQQALAAPDVAEADLVLDRARDGLARTEAAFAEAETRNVELRGIAEAARRAAATAAAEVDRLDVEARTLSRLLDRAAAKGFRSIIEDVTVAAGFETAFAAAFRDDLAASQDPAAPAHWRALDPDGRDPPLPEGVVPLARYVAAPAALSRRLAQTGVVEGDGASLQPHLAPGQCLVSRAGDVWRWDGLILRGGTETGDHLFAERARLRALTPEVEAARARLTGARADADRDQAAADAASRALAEARSATASARVGVDRARDARARVESEVSRRLAALAEGTGALSRLRAELADARATLAEAQAASARRRETGSEGPLPDATGRALETARTALGELRASADARARERSSHRDRLATLERGIADWTARLAGTGERLDALRARRKAALDERSALADLPSSLDEERIAIERGIGGLRARLDAATADLRRAEEARSASALAARESLGVLATRREALARCEAACLAARSALEAAARSAAETAPADAAGRHDPRSDAEIAADLARQRAERERLGAVNLRADEELREAEDQRATLESDKADLESAIASLRTAIATLNRDGRERLLAAFEIVHAHFTALFSRLFGGGEARLELVEAEDPLEAGLEIWVAPPGKRAQTLSLLSGGEQALTAMALIFAIFLTNPAPICVLDEVDAPLDDANVARFCDLLDAMTRDTDTRFLVVTHNPVTMARMDRLFGVTMAERGVSRLVSVDLATAERLREAV